MNPKGWLSHKEKAENQNHGFSAYNIWSYAEQWLEEKSVSKDAHKILRKPCRQDLSLSHHLANTMPGSYNWVDWVSFVLKTFFFSLYICKDLQINKHFDFSMQLHSLCLNSSELCTRLPALMPLCICFSALISMHADGKLNYEKP